MSRCILISLLTVLGVSTASQACWYAECNICGYVYSASNGDPDNGIEPGTRLEDLPDDWICPICGASKSEFECIDMGTCHRPIISLLPPRATCNPPECDGVWIFEFEFGNCGGVCALAGNQCLSAPNADIQVGRAYACAPPDESSPDECLVDLNTSWPFIKKGNCLCGI